MEFPDKPEQVLFPITLNKETDNEKQIGLHIGNCAIALFRRRPNMDYLAVKHEEEEEEIWTFIFDKHDLIYWMGNLALHVRDRDNVRLANGKYGSFYSRYGFNPPVIVEDYPGDNEFETYVAYIKDGWSIPESIPLEEAEDDD